MRQLDTAFLVLLLIAGTISVSACGPGRSNFGLQVEIPDALRSDGESPNARLLLVNQDTLDPAANRLPLAETPGFTPRSAPPVVLGGSAVVCDAQTGRILYRKNADKKRPVASTQKLMTALILAMDGGLEETVTVVKSDGQVEPSKLKISDGETYTRKHLLEAMLVKSGNDAARCLARDNAGTYEAFALKMNAMAKRLGMQNSNFVNPSGLTVDGQYSTARDMTRLALVAYRNPVIRNAVGKKSLTFKHSSSGRTEILENTNKLLARKPHCTGMKTGYTLASGRCLVAAGAKPGREIIVIVLGSGNMKKGWNQIWKDAGDLLDWGLDELGPEPAEQQ